MELDELFLAWLAGFWEGEGSFTLHYHDKPSSFAR